MKRPSTPLATLALVVAGWVGLRAAMLAPDWLQQGGGPVRDLVADVAAQAAPVTPASAQIRGPDATLTRSNAAGAASFLEAHRPPGWLPSILRAGFEGALDAPVVAIPSPIAPGADARVAASPSPIPTLPMAASVAPQAIATVLPLAIPPALRQTAAAPPASRWTASAWLFLRDRGGGDLAPGGVLGGSQAGARLGYRLNGDARRPLAASARLYVPLERTQGAEAALGLDWRPFARLPFHFLAERRQRIGREGRSDFALTVYGGGETRLLRDRVRVEAYGQAGIVGIEDRDLFADGMAVATTRIGPIDVGAGIWGGAQPGVARLDVGPHASFRLPIGRVVIRATGEWRFRVAGEAAPASGPAITIATGF